MGKCRTVVFSLAEASAICSSAQGHVGGAEIDRAIQKLGYAVGGTDRAVVDLDPRWAD